MRALASEGRIESDQAERKDVSPGLNCPSIAGPGSPAAIGAPENGSASLPFYSGGRWPLEQG